MNRGYLIVLEGIDRAGKTTQATRLAAALVLSGHAAVSLRFPDRASRVGKLIDAHLKGEVRLNPTELRNAFFENFVESIPKVRMLLQQGVTVVADRYVYSHLCYTVAAHARSKMDALCLTAQEVERCGEFPMPDLVFFLDVPPAVAETRGGYGAEIFDKAAFQSKVREGFSRMAEMCKWAIVDAAQGRDSVTHKIWALAHVRLSKPPVDKDTTKITFFSS